VREIETIWQPSWYECDQAIRVGQIAEFDFFKTPPPYVMNEGKRVFYHGRYIYQGSYVEDQRYLFETIRLRIVSIRHPQLGSIESIDTEGLDYTFLMMDARIIKVNAEEEPGRIYEYPVPIGDWRIYVQSEIL
jgi:hypothetical protein